MGKRNEISKRVIPKSHRYDPSNVMGSHALINIVTGARTFGKTYAFKKIAIKHAINSGEKWVYSRYYQDNLKEQLKKGDFFSDIMLNNEFPGKLLMCRGSQMLIADKPKKIDAKPKWKQFGTFAALNDMESFRGASTADVTLWHFDEFIIKKRQARYPAGTVDMFWDVFDSLDRREDRVRVVLSANTANLINPFFREWNVPIIPQGTSRYFKVGRTEIFYENAYNPEFERDSCDSYIGRATEGSTYADYATYNEFTQMTGMFVKNKPASAKCHLSITYMGEHFGVWMDGFTGDSYVTRRASREAAKCALTRDDMTPNFMLIDKNYPYLKYCKKCYSYGQLFFESDKIRESFLDMLAMLGLK